MKTGLSVCIISHYVSVRVGVAKILAGEKKAARNVEKCKRDVSRYSTAAQNALRAGDEDAAMLLFAKKHELESTLPQLQQTSATAHESIVQLYELRNKLSAGANL